MTYLHKASRCLKILFGGGMMGQGSVGTFNGHSPLYLNLLHTMISQNERPLKVSGDIKLTRKLFQLITGKQLQVNHFGAALQQIWDFEWWNLIEENMAYKVLTHQCSIVHVFELLAAFFGRYLGISIWSQCWVQDIAIPQTKIDSACNKPQVFFVQEIVTEAWLYNWI